MSQAELNSIIERLEALFAAWGETPALEDMRSGWDGLFQAPADATSTPVDAAGVPAEWIAAPGAREDRAFLYLHGGGYMIGSIDSHRDLVARISGASGARGLAIDYRLAPENPFPAAVEDATTAFRWMIDQGIAPERSAIGGDSAGGGLTVATLLSLRDASHPLPAAGVLLSPWTDLACSGESMTTKAEEDPMVGPGMIGPMAQAYLSGKDPKTPLASPLYGNLSGLPPLLIQLGSRETLYDDSTRLAERAKAAGVDVTLEPWEGMIHVFHIFAPELSEGREAIGGIGKFLRARWG